ncbi:MAG TPA: hypothetical protein VK858_12995 [Longimicrobiales bacterium]|nr:hypothetical protein [Longimicrobiales bacterium]
MKSVLDKVTELWADLRRRRVVRAGGVYWLGTVAVLGVLDLLRDLSPWLDRTFPSIVLLSIVLFPVVLGFSWAFEWTGDGIRLHRPGPGERVGVHQRLGIIGLLSIATFLFGWGILSLWARSEQARTEAVRTLTTGVENERRDPMRLAVLYFDDYSPDGDLDYLANGLTEGLIAALGEVEELTVTSRNGVRDIRDAPSAGETVAERLGVGTLVTGSVSGRSGGRVRVNAQLVDVTTGDTQLWSGQFESATVDVLTLQTELVSEISRRLRRSLGVSVRAREAAEETASEEAWRAYHQAKQLVARAMASDAVGSYAEELFDQADGLLVSARAMDPEWGAPVVERGWLEYRRSRLRSSAAGSVRPEDGLGLLRLADEAVATTAASPAALELRGVVQFELAEAAAEGDPALRDAAEQDLVEAVRKDPRRAQALAYLGRGRRLAGDFPAARDYARRALEADAFLEEADEVVFLLFETNLELKRWDAADRWCMEGRRRFPSGLNFLFCRLQFEVLRPDVALPATAWSLLDSIRAAAPAEDWTWSYRPWAGFQVAGVLARNDMPDSARSVLDRYRPDPEDRPWFAYDEAYVELLLGDPDVALDLLALYLGARPDRRTYLSSDWLFEELWDDPGFRELTGREPATPQR